MLGKESSNYKGSQELETVIGPSVKVKGNFVSQGNIKIEGSLNGTLDTTGNVKIGGDAQVKANVTAREIYIAGKLEGTIKASEKLVLTSTAKIIGDIETKILAIESGAYFSGKCNMEFSKSLSKEDKKEDDDKNAKK